MIKAKIIPTTKPLLKRIVTELGIFAKAVLGSPIIPIPANIGMPTEKYISFLFLTFSSSFIAVPNIALNIVKIAAYATGVGSVVKNAIIGVIKLTIITKILPIKNVFF